MKQILNFRNAVQHALFTCELQGQISDGMWENARPDNHWRVWCNCEVKVNEKNVGRNFYAQKDSYNFTSSELLDIIGDRMLRIANMSANGVSLDAINMFNDYDEKCYQMKDEYWQNKAKQFDVYFGSWEEYEKKCSGVYDMKKLKEELRDMKNIIRIMD